MREKRIQGSVTVYLALVFLLIVSMVFVSLEASRAAVMRGCAKAALQSGIESVLADYYRPLFDRYKIFALDLGYGNNTADIAEAEKRISRFAAANADGYSFSDCRVTKTYPLISDGGSYFIREAVDAEEITLAEGALESLAEKLGILTGQSEVSRILARRTALEAEIAELDVYTSDLMRSIDGVDVDVNSILGGKNVYRIRDSFVKRFMIGNTDSYSVGINNPSIYSTIRDKYSNPVERTLLLSVQMEEYARLTAEAEALLEQINILSEEMSILSAGMTDISSEVGTAGNNSPLAALQNEIEALYKRYDDQMLRVNRKAAQCRKEINALNRLYSETEEELKNVRKISEAAQFLQDELKPKVEAFESFLESFSGILDEDTLLQLGSSLGNMKEYVGLTEAEDSCDFRMLEETSHADILLLNGNRATEILSMPAQESEAIAKKARELTVLAERMNDFSYDGMKFDYSVTGAVSEKESAIDTITELLLEPVSDSWLDLVMGDSETLSKAKLSDLILPVIEGKEKAEGAGMSAIGGIVGGIIGQGADKEEAMSLAAGEGSVFSAICEILGNGFGKLYEKALFTMYLHDRFNSFRTPDRLQGSVLKYEQEYLLCGNMSDKVNLAGSLVQVMLIRLVPSMVFAFTDSTVTSQAAAAAQAVVGFLCFPFLTLLVKILILFVWALEQAVVETGAIVRGKDVPVLTNQSSFCLKIGELVGFSSSKVAEKAESFIKKEPCLDYEEYLFILLMIRKNATMAGRSLDLIQENLRTLYEENFLISNCVVGIEAEGTAEADLKFISVFKNISVPENISGYSVKVSGEGSYCIVR